MTRNRFRRVVAGWIDLRARVTCHMITLKVMKNEISLQTRREFLRTTVLGSALSWTVPAFLADTFAALHSDAADSATQIITGKDATILVVLQMAGGNDGLNTVVPLCE